MKKWLLRLSLVVLLVLALGAAYLAFRRFGSTSRNIRVVQWIRGAEAHPEWAVEAGQRCGEAPFLVPSSGYIGFLWGDSFRIGHRHQGIDLFSGTEAGQTPVIAAYSGYLTRLPDWKSSLIVRIPADPLQPERQIWTYYTHLAAPDGSSLIAEDFPPGTSERYVEAGTLLGWQGNYSGNPDSPVGVHLHFSIVLDDGQGSFLNELKIQNTLDPSPYFGLNLNASKNKDEIPLCASQKYTGEVQ
jgi:murein DD-endopeptidase MepM/ murein hydrolase activator NlpD